MPTTYTSLLGLALPATGELSGTWGTTVNDAITSLVDSSVAGTTTLSSDADVTLTTTSGVANQARQAIILWTANGTTTRNITAPATSKTYVVINASAGTQSIVIRGAGPTTGVTIIKGERAVVAWNGSDFVKVSLFGGALTVSDLTDSSLTSGRVTYATTGGNLTDSANLTFNGTTLTANALVGIGGSPSVGGVQLTVLGGGTQLSPGTTAQEGLRVQRATGFATLTGINNDNNAYNGLQFFTSASAAVTVDTSGNVAVGTTNAGTAGLSLSQNYNLSWEQSATESVPNLFRQTSSAALVMSVGYKRSATANGFASSFGSSLAKTAISLGTTAGAITFYTDTAATTAVGTDVTPTERMRIDSSGNVGIGTASPGSYGRLGVMTPTANNGFFGIANSAGGAGGVQMAQYYSTVKISYIDTTLTNGTPGSETAYLAFATANSGTLAEQMRIDASGNVGIGTAPSYTLDVYRSGTNTSVIVARNDNSVASLYSTSSFSFAGTSTNTPFGFITNNLERMRFLAGGGITSEDRADAVGYKGTPLNEQSTAYTLVIGDMGKSIVHPASDNNARTFTIPANGTVAFPVGTTITFINMINTVTIAITTDTMYLAGAGTTGSRTLAAYGMATAVKMTSTTWIISGNGLT